jgi:hypothetical protein
MAQLIMFKIRAFTILETIVALTISLLIFAMMASLLVRIDTKTYTSRRVKAHELLTSYFMSMNEKDSFYNSVIILDRFTLKSQCTEVDGYQNLFKTKFEIFDENGILMEQHNRFIISKPLRSENQDGDFQ